MQKKIIKGIALVLTVVFVYDLAKKIIYYYWLEGDALDFYPSSGDPAVNLQSLPSVIFMASATMAFLFEVGIIMGFFSFWLRRIPSRNYRYTVSLIIILLACYIGALWCIEEDAVPLLPYVCIALLGKGFSWQAHLLLQILLLCLATAGLFINQDAMSRQGTTVKISLRTMWHNQVKYPVPRRFYKAVHIATSLLIIGICTYGVRCKLRFMFSPDHYRFNVDDDNSRYAAMTIAELLGCGIILEIVTVALFIIGGLKWSAGKEACGIGPYKYAYFTLGLHILTVLFIRADFALLSPYLDTELLGTGYSWLQHLVLSSVLLLMFLIAGDLRYTLAWERLRHA